jgi:hypothetical protein
LATSCVQALEQARHVGRAEWCHGIRSAHRLDFGEGEHATSIEQSFDERKMSSFLVRPILNIASGFGPWSY